MKSVFFAAIFGLTFVASPASAEDKDPLAVVELFTSQGCNSCPPADAALVELLNEGSVLPLAFHVDYWNYLGWKDTLSSRENTERQHGYAHNMRRTMVYTPQVVINGRAEMTGSNLQGIRNAVTLLKAAGEGLSVPVRATIRNGEIDITIAEGEGKADVVIAYFKAEEKVKITRGENAGKTLTYVNSVSKLQTIGMWDGEAAAFKLPLSVMAGNDYDGCAVLLQAFDETGSPGPIYGAATVMEKL
jgi:hypothetical protein